MAYNGAMDPVNCHQCGGVNQPLAPPPWSCKYCGVPMAAPVLPEGCIWLTDDAVLAYVAGQVGGVESTFLHPSIPPKKLANARKVHAAHLPPEEYVLALYDGTAFGSATEGFVITSRRICWKNTMEAAGQLAWDHVDQHDIYCDETTIKVGRAKLETLLEEGDEGLYAWVDVIETLARSARPGQAAATGELPKREADAAWGGPEVAVSGPTSGGAYGGMAAAQAAPQHAWQVAVAGYAAGHYERPGEEQLPAAPYQSDESVSVVDVHPSGEMFLCAGGSTVEIKYAANGARYLAFPTPSSVGAAKFSPDGNWLLVGAGKRVYLHDSRSAQRTGMTEKLSDYCEHIEWLGPTKFAMGSQDGEVWIVDAMTMQRVVRLLKPDAEYSHLEGMASSADGSRLFVSIGERIGAFDVASGKIVWRLDNASSHCGKLSMAPNGQALVAAGYDGIAFIDATTGQPGATRPFYCGRGVAWPEGTGGLFKKKGDGMSWSWTPRAAFSPNGDVVAVTDSVGNLNFLDLATATLHPTPRDRGRAWIESVAWFRDGNHLLVGMSDNSVAVWSARPMVGRLHCVGLQPLPDEAYNHLPDEDSSDGDLDDDDLDDDDDD